CASGHVSIHLEVVHATGRSTAIRLFDDHHRSVVCERFREHAVAAHGSTTYEAAPPRVCDLVCGAVERLIDLAFLDTTDERCFRKRHHPRKRTTEDRVGRYLDDTHVAVRIRAELACGVLERRLHAVHHAIEIVAVS